jgi:hypothetical protein
MDAVACLADEAVVNSAAESTAVVLVVMLNCHSTTIRVLIRSADGHQRYTFVFANRRRCRRCGNHQKCIGQYGFPFVINATEKVRGLPMNHGCTRGRATLAAK